MPENDASRQRADAFLQEFRDMLYSRAARAAWSQRLDPDDLFQQAAVAFLQLAPEYLSQPAHSEPLAQAHYVWNIAMKRAASRLHRLGRAAPEGFEPPQAASTLAWWEILWAQVEPFVMALPARPQLAVLAVDLPARIGRPLVLAVEQEHAPSWIPRGTDAVMSLLIELLRAAGVPDAYVMAELLLMETWGGQRAEVRPYYVRLHVERHRALKKLGEALQS